MSKKVINKRNKKNWETGDTFYLEIKKSKYKENIGKYLIFIIAEDKWPLGPTFRVKITKDKTMPKTYEEIENLEYIITRVNFKEQADRFLDKNPNKKLKADEYGYIYVYQIQVGITNRKYQVSEDFTYIGNFHFSLPENEYIPDFSACIPYELWPDVEEKLSNNYYLYNLRKWGCFDKEIARKWRGETLETWAVFDAIQKADEEGRLEFYEDKIKKRSSLTYVGGDPNHPDYKCKIKKED